MNTDFLGISYIRKRCNWLPLISSPLSLYWFNKYQFCFQEFFILWPILSSAFFSCIIRCSYLIADQKNTSAWNTSNEPVVWLISRNTSHTDTSFISSRIFHMLPNVALHFTEMKFIMAWFIHLFNKIICAVYFNMLFGSNPTR